MSYCVKVQTLDIVCKVQPKVQFLAQLVVDHSTSWATAARMTEGYKEQELIQTKSGIIIFSPEKTNA